MNDAGDTDVHVDIAMPGSEEINHEAEDITRAE